MYKPALTSGALFAALAVILGAFGAHALKAVVAPDQLLVFETGVRYQFYHSLGLLLTGIIYRSFPAKNVRLATSFFITGIVLFSGSLYAMVTLSIRGAGLGPLGIITPIGGLFFILGWILLLLSILKKPLQ
jgi:uncharacterized membrane protein YgdD (TMEM256/DUF423 family)